MYKRLSTGLAVLVLVVMARPVTAQRADAPRRAPQVYLGVAVDAAQDRAGALVREVTPDGPAAKAGLKSGDVILKVGDRDVKDPDDLIHEVARHKAGDRLTFHVVHEGREKDVSVTLAERPSEAAAGGARPGAFLGVVTRPLTPADKSRLGVSVDQGLVVSDVMPDSPAAKAGLRRGDVINAVGGKTVTDPNELRQMIQQTGAGKDITLTLLRGQEKKEVQARLDEPPVDGITPPLLPPLGRPFTSRFGDASDKIADLERRLADLERRVRELEQKRQ